MIRLSLFSVRAALAVTLFAVTFASCTQISTEKPQPVDSTAIYLKKLNEYKKSDHKKFVGYFNGLEKSVSADSTRYMYSNLRLVPDSVDVVDIFTHMGKGNKELWNNFDKIKADINYLQKRGTKVVNCVWLTDFQDWHKNADGTPVYNHNEADYDKFAKLVYDYFTEWGLDGIDVDMEPELIYSKEQTKGLLKALSKYFGPKSGNNISFIFDTDQTSGTIFQIFNDTYSYYNNVIFQGYNCAGDRWSGNQNMMTGVVNQYGKLIGNKNVFFLTNGEKPCAWNVNSALGKNTLIEEYALWALKTDVGGIGAYGFNLDYNNNKYSNVRKSIATMNSPQ
ncbi:glycoside hydrolase family 18 [Chitinophaga sp. OAE865]|uniref:glycoside hydrolase family 18 n=1 Tax=Chitinophaga sp. OAE865 TaxID=2817898 RepID=UPI001AE4A42C